MLEKYRESMSEDVFHSWAKDAQGKIDQMHTILSELKTELFMSYNMSPEGRKYLEKIDEALEL